MDTFARDWTFRNALVTVSYPQGWRGELPKNIQLAARKARVLIPPSLENQHGNDVRPAKTRAARRPRRIKE